MIHENEIAIKVLTNEFADYPRNAWHYDREYLIICEALRLSKLHQPTVMHCVCENGDFGDIEVLEIDDRCVPSCKNCLKPLRKHGA